MSILIDRATRLVVQGITGREGEFHARAMKDYGTAVVAGVTPGKGGQTALDGAVPVFDTVGEAVRETGVNTSCIFVPAGGAPDAVLEAVAAGIATIFCITEGIPALDMIPVVAAVQQAGARLIGPNCPGATSPGMAKVGIIPASIHRQGRVGVVSRSGTLTYEAVQAMTDAGIGQSTCVGIGGDPVIGSTFLDARFELDGPGAGDRTVERIDPAWVTAVAMIRDHEVDAVAGRWIDLLEEELGDLPREEKPWIRTLAGDLVRFARDADRAPAVLFAWSL